MLRGAIHPVSTFLAVNGLSHALGKLFQAPVLIHQAFAYASICELFNFLQFDLLQALPCLLFKFFHFFLVALFTLLDVELLLSLLVFALLLFSFCFDPVYLLCQALIFEIISAISLLIG